jgi:hypothetical protein
LLIDGLPTFGTRRGANMQDREAGFRGDWPLLPTGSCPIVSGPPLPAFHSVNEVAPPEYGSRRRGYPGAVRANRKKLGHRAHWLLPVALAATLAGCVPSRESLTAGQIGCPPSEVSTSNPSSSGGWNQSAETWTAECRGRRFVCSEVTTSSFDLDWLFSDASDSIDSDVSCHEELGPTHARALASPRSDGPVTASSVPPIGGAGFELGLSRAAARQRCEGAAHRWEAIDAGHASCSGTATPLGFPATTGLAFCAAVLCGITVSHTPTAHWIRPFSALQTTLAAKYGAASKRRLRIPSMCRTDEQFDRCALDGTLDLSVSWQWPTGQRLRLSLGRASPHAGESAVRLTYVMPPRPTEPNASAL